VAIGPAEVKPCVEVRAPPEWDTVTPGATSVDVAELAAPPEPMTEAAGGASGPGLVVAEAGGPGCGGVSAPLVWFEPAAAVEPSVASGLANATPPGVAIAVPTPSATARAPTRPTKLL
jgi:hypothetical protein